MKPTHAWGRVLIIDDEAGIREVFKKFLSLLGHQADTAVDGEEGLRLVDRTDYALVITDLKMPGMNGIEVAMEIKRRAPGTRLLMVSGSAVATEVEQIRALGVPFLEKPVTLRDFTAAVEGALRARRRGVLRAVRGPLSA